MINTLSSREEKARASRFVGAIRSSEGVRGRSEDEESEGDIMRIGGRAKSEQMSLKKDNKRRRLTDDFGAALGKR